MAIETSVGALDGWMEQRIQVPVARVLAGMGITANMMTLAGLAGCLLAAILLQINPLACAVVFVVASACDAFDGSLARLRGPAAVSRLGGWLDAFTGTLCELSLYTSMLFFTDNTRTLRLVGVSAFSTVLVSHVKSVAGEYGIVPDWREVRVLGRTLRVFALFVGLAAAGLLARQQESIIAFTLVSVITLNLVVFGHRLRKIVRCGQGKSMAFESDVPVARENEIWPQDASAIAARANGKAAAPRRTAVTASNGHRPVQNDAKVM